MSKVPDLSVIVPVYNEEKRVEKGLKEILNFLSKQKFSWELILVDDGSTDKTEKIVRKNIAQNKNAQLVSSRHQGKGGAIKKGVLTSKGKWVLFLDIDLATPMEELTKFRSQIKNFDVLIGSRKMTGARILLHQPKFRELSGKVFTFLTNALVTSGISDITCGFKMYKGRLAKQLFKQSVLRDWSFDAEILFLAQKKKARIKEIAVTWKDDPHTKVNIFQDAFKSFSGLLKIRVNDLRGLYRD